MTSSSTTTTTIPFRYMVKGSNGTTGSQTTSITTTTTKENDPPIDNYLNNTTKLNYYYKWYPILKTDVSLSFWGGIDPITGIIIDTKHPLIGQCVTDTIFVLPSGRGSCTASQVLLELILNKRAPHAIILRDHDPMVTIGVIIAQEIFPNIITPDIIYIGTEGYNTIMKNHNNDKEEEEDIIVATIQSEQAVLHLGRQSQNIVNDDNIIIPTKPSTTIVTTSEQNDNEMQLTEKEIELMNNCTTDAQRMALKVIFRYTRVCQMGNDDNNTNSSIIEYVPISSGHIDGCTYIGPGGLQFVQHLVTAGGKVVVPTTLNSVSTDRKQWEYYGVPINYAKNSIALGDAYLQLGCIPSFTCAPYLLLNNNNDTNNNTNQSSSSSSSILENMDIAWGESNAVVYSNSILGARTEKYADYLDVCCAIAGIVPAVGVHIPKNRIPTILLDATTVFTTIQNEIVQNNNTLFDIDILFPTLGYLCGLLADGYVPMVIGLQNNKSFWKHYITNDHWKAFCAAYGTTGSSPLIHIAGITPEVRDENIITKYIKNCQNNNNSKLITMDLLQDTYDTLNNNDTNTSNESSATTTKIDLIAIGNPHLSKSECYDIANRIRQLQQQQQQLTKVIATTRIVACMSRTIREQIPVDDINCMEHFGIEFVYDTCWCMILNEPLIPIGFESTILTNSGKYAHYGPGLTNRQYKFGSLQDCIITAITGYYNPNYTNNNNNKNNNNEERHFLFRHHGRAALPNSNARTTAATSIIIPKREYSTMAMTTNRNINQPSLPIRRCRRIPTNTRSTPTLLRSLVHTIRRWR